MGAELEIDIEADRWHLIYRLREMQNRRRHARDHEASTLMEQAQRLRAEADELQQWAAELRAQQFNNPVDERAAMESAMESLLPVGMTIRTQRGHLAFAEYLPHVDPNHGAPMRGEHRHHPPLAESMAVARKQFAARQIPY
jgi:hypothetical protein